MDSDWFSYLDRKTAPRPSHKRLPPSKVAITQERVSVRNPEPKPEPMVVEESTASDSMITRIIGKFRGG